MRENAARRSALKTLDARALRLGRGRVACVFVRCLRDSTRREIDAKEIPTVGRVFCFVALPDAHWGNTIEYIERSGGGSEYFPPG